MVSSWTRRRRPQGRDARTFGSMTPPLQAGVWSVVVALAVVLAACEAPPANPMPESSATASSSTPSPPTAHPTTTGVPSSDVPPVVTAVLVEHRIGVRTIDGVGEFFDRETGERFVPRGTNYNILKVVDDPANGHTALDVTLSTDFYAPDQVEADLTAMEDLGYNIVRIMPETCGGTGCVATWRINPEWVANLVDFLARAKEHGIYVWIASNTLPDVGYYVQASHSLDDAHFQSVNTEFLAPGAVGVYAEYFHDLISEMIAQGAAMDAVFGYELRQEQSFDSSAPPLSLTKGSVTAANGKTYDLGMADERLRMADEGLIYWIDTIRGVIRDLDPTAIVSIGFFAPNEPHMIRDLSDSRLVRSVASFGSTADFLDFHVYPTPGVADLAVYVDNFQMLGRDEKPIVMGELAAFHWYPTAAAGAQALHDLQVESCDVGFDGWLIWSWDIEVQDDIWHALSGNGEVAEALAPSNRPDPCAPADFDFFEYALTDGAMLQASRSLLDEPVENAFDKGPAQWGSGGEAPQWIQARFAAARQLDVVRLVVAQYPQGDTVHEVWVTRLDGPQERVHIFSGFTTEGDILEYRPVEPLRGVVAVRIVTTSSPSWVAWQDVEFLSSTPP